MGEGKVHDDVGGNLTEVNTREMLCVSGLGVEFGSGFGYHRVGSII
jgi:hypothetical protein